MKNYRLPNYRLYHDSLVSEFFWQLENVMDVLRGRAQHQQRFKEATLSMAFSIIQNIGTIGSVVSVAGNAVLSLTGQYQEKERVQILTPEYLSGDWAELRKIIEVAAEMVVERYRYFLANRSEADAVELGRVSAQRLWEYIPRKKLSFTTENILIGILKGNSGSLYDNLRNTRLTVQNETAEGALERAGIVYCDISDQWHYLQHPDHPCANGNLPKYGFMLLSETLARTRMIEEGYSVFVPSDAQTQLLKNTWSAPIAETIAEDSVTISSVLIPEVCDRLDQLKTDWLSFNNWRNTVEQQLNNLALQSEENRVEIIEVKEKVTTLSERQDEQHLRLNLIEMKMLSSQTPVNLLLHTEWTRFIYKSNPYFQPRTALLTALEQAFSIEHSLFPIVLAGLGGTGKSSLASQWSHMQEPTKRYLSIRWMVMDNVNIEKSLMDLAQDLHVDIGKKTQEECFVDIARHLKDESWLIVWDNVNDYSSVEKILPYFTSTQVNQHLLITSRDTTSWANPIIVEAYSSQESIGYIQHQMTVMQNPWFNADHAAILAERLGYHPLALELAMAPVCLYKRPLDKYLNDLEKAGLTGLNVISQKLSSQARINTHNLTTLWKIGLEKLPQDAVGLLRLMSFISTEGVRRELLYNFLDQDNARCDAALLALRQQSFIQTIAHPVLEKWHVHRLLQEIVRTETLLIWQADKEAFSAFFKKNTTTFETTFETDVNKLGVEAIEEGVLHGSQWLVHLQQFSVELKTTRSFIEFQEGLLSFLGAREISLARYLAAQAHLIQALNISRTLFDQDANSFHISYLLSHLGYIYLKLSDFSNAQDYYQQALSVLQARVDQDTNHRLAIAGVLNNIGMVYSELGNFFEAKNYWIQTITMQRELLGPNTNDLDIATVLSNLGGVNESLGDFSCAINYYQQALIMQRSLLGKDINHLDIARSLDQLGVVYLAKGDFHQAQDYFIQALTMQHVLLGQDADYPAIALTLNNLGAAHAGLGNPSIAQNYLTQSLAMRYALFGQEANDSGIATTLSNLGDICAALGDFSTARDYFQKVLAMQRVLFGQTASHPDIIFSLVNLGNASLKLEDFTLAYNYHLKALTMKRELFGQDANHPDIIKSLKDLSVVCWAQRNLKAARDYLTQMLIMQHALFSQNTNPSMIVVAQNHVGLTCSFAGDFSSVQDVLSQMSMMIACIHFIQDANHHDIAETLNDLGMVCSMTGDLSTAQDYHLQALTMRRKLIGQNNNHPNVAESLYNLGVIYLKQGDFSEARDYFTQALAMQHALFGKETNHSDTVKTFASLGAVVTRQGQFVEAKAYLNAALIMAKAMEYDEDNPLVVDVKVYLQQIEEMTNLRDELKNLSDTYISKYSRSFFRIADRRKISEMRDKLENNTFSSIEELSGLVVDATRGGHTRITHFQEVLTSSRVQQGGFSQTSFAVTNNSNCESSLPQKSEGKSCTIS